MQAVTGVSASGSFLGLSIPQEDEERHGSSYFDFDSRKLK